MLLFTILFRVALTPSVQILHRRMLRLRTATGNPDLKTQAEIEAADITGAKIASMLLWRPLVLFWEPTLLVYNTYLALIYGWSTSFRSGDRLTTSHRSALRLVREFPAGLPGGTWFQCGRVGSSVSISVALPGLIGDLSLTDLFSFLGIFVGAFVSCVRPPS